MQRISVFLWIAVGGAILQLVAVGSDFYRTLGQNGEPKTAWFGVPHTADLLVGSAVVTIALLALTAVNRQPARGRTVGLIVAGIGLLATLQLVYRMITPPFGGCLQYGCAFNQAAEVDLLAGIWFALAGCVAVVVGGLLHALSGRGRDTAARPWIAERQTGMTPWLGLSVLGVLALFVFPFTGFTLYEVNDFLGSQGTQPWGGWLSIPHTSSVVLAAMLIVIGLVIAAARNRSPISPPALGAAIAVVAFIGTVRLLYRVIDSPFDAAGGSGTHVGAVDVQLAGYLGLAGGVVAIVAGIVHAAQHQAEGQPSTQQPTRPGEPRVGTI